jgi:hypothetical protein
MVSNDHKKTWRNILFSTRNISALFATLIALTHEQHEGSKPEADHFFGMF